VNVAGISAFYHESAACLLRDGRLVAAAAEERFSRRKHDAALPVAAFRSCLEAGGLTAADLDAVAFYELPVEKLSRQLWAGPPAGQQHRQGGHGGAAADLAWLDPRRPQRAIAERLGVECPVLAFPHHRSHAASAFCFSGFDEAAVLTVDGVGEWATTTYGRADAGGIERLEEVRFPHSLGLLYSAVTSFLGFRVNGGEYKVMGLAPYGQPRFAAAMEALVASGAGGAYALDLRYFDFVRGRTMWSPAMAELLGGPPRRPDEPIEAFHCDVARSLQERLEEILLEKARFLHGRTGARDLCFAGGVALNAVANGRIAREGPFERLFVPPAPGDAGGCLGAAALAHRELAGSWEGLRLAPLDARMGPRFTPQEIASWLAASGLRAEGVADHRGREGELVEEVARRLAAGEVVGWFHGRMEFGPRALGARSFLASPLDAALRERLNAVVKRREPFRPFAPSVLAEHAAANFELDHPSPYMLETCRVRSPLELPAITHVDGSARPQTVDRAAAPRFAALLDAFLRRTGCPMLLNTSFNVADEPIVCSPEDAVRCFAISGADALVLEDFLIERAAVPETWAALLPAARPDARESPDEMGALRENLYSFV
jgi:carbamoyltransferase